MTRERRETRELDLGGLEGSPRTDVLDAYDELCAASRAVPCKACDTTGFVPTGVTELDRETGHYDLFRECRACGGTGGVLHETDEREDS